MLQSIRVIWQNKHQIFHTIRDTFPLASHDRIMNQKLWNKERSRSVKKSVRIA